MVIPENNLEVNLDIHRSKIKGVSHINARKGEELLLDKGSLKIISLGLNNHPVNFNEEEGIIKLIPEENGTLEINYEGTFKATSSVKATSLKTHYVTQSVIDERGVSLTGLWYPRIEGLGYYKLKVTLPKGYEAISEAEEIRRVEKERDVEFLFSFPYPVDDINLVASKKYNVITDHYNDIEIYAYFFEGDSDLAENYITYTKNYLKLYENLIGKYPFKRFSIVENFLPTGYSMPTFVLLGKTVIRLPFIVETSLGHEILHQWFGGLVYIDYERGNWAEGLTTYLADHLYKEQNRMGWNYRKQILIDYKSYVNDENEFPLRDFMWRINPSSKAIGYGKAAMVFHMLKNIVGEEAFFISLRDFINENRFRKASWDDLKLSFEKFYGKSLELFFRQWIDEKGMPRLYLKNAKVKYANGSFELSFNINQDGKIYELDAPVTIYSNGKAMKRFFRINKKENLFKIFLSNEPEKIVIDEDYDIARLILDEETPPVISRLLGDKKYVISLPLDNKRIYQGIIDFFKDKGASVKDAKDIKDSEVKSSSLIILGYNNQLINRLYGRLNVGKAGFGVTIKDNPWNSNKVVGVFYGKSREEIDSGFKKISHYGKNTSLLFDNGRNISKEVKKTQRGIGMKLKDEAVALDISSISTLSSVIDSVADKKIVYVGEFHDVFAHHAVQLDIIKGLYSKNEKIAIGMEMFQRPFQKTLDDYIAGRIDEREFLEKTEYFKRWGFDYNLYKPILDFAWLNKIPVVALNMEREIIDKVSENGIDSLSEEEREEIPHEMDFSDNDYRERIKKIFKQHKDWEEKNFDYFFQSQIMWDETMSESVDGFLRSNPDYQIVVIAGQGHLEYGSGIPKRTFRRNGYNYAIVLIDADVEEDIADFVIFPKPVEGVTSPKLMVFLNAEEGKVEISGFPEKSVSEEAGLKAGDVILSMDGRPISSIEDIKIQLFYKKGGDTIRIKVLRKEETEEKEMEFKVKL